jgi:hypothetical protein
LILGEEITESVVEMPMKDPVARREATKMRMRRLRAERGPLEDPVAEAERKRRWYLEGGKEKIIAANRVRKQRANDQNLTAFLKQMTPN